MAERKFLDLLGLQKYDEKIKAHLAAADAEILAASKQYFEDNADRFDAAGTAATKVQELADGAVKANTEAIAKLNGAADVDGSVAKAVADAKSELNGTIQGVDAKAEQNISDISGLKGRMDAVEGKAQTNANDISGLSGRMDTAEADIDAIQEDLGDVDSLSTTNKTVAGAINEVLAAVGTGGTAAVVSVTAKGATSDYANVYEIAQGGSVVGTINIPKDMVVESGSVVDLADGEVEGYAAGKYIKLVLQNVEAPLYIAVASLVDIYVAKAEAAQVQVEINSNSREISAHIVAGSVTSVELADNAVITAKIADANVTKAKLSAEVQASLAKADVAEENAKAHADSLDEAMDLRMQAVEAKLTGNGEGTVEEKIEAAKEAAISAASADATSKANAAEAAAKGHADSLNTAMDTRVQALEAIDHDHTNKAELDLIQTGDVAKWNAAQSNAEATAAGALAAAKTELEGKITDGDKVNKDLIDGHDTRIQALETKVGDGFIEITEGEINALFATQA